MPKKQKTNNTAFIVSLIAALTLALIGANGHPTRVEVVALSAGLLVCFLVLFSGWALKRGLSVAERMGHVSASIVASLILSGFYLWHFYPPIRRHVLDEDEISRFEAPLKTQTNVRFDIQLACPTADEPTCVYAAQFIPLLKDSGWKVQGNQVARVSLGIPYEGIRLFEYVEKYPPQDAPSNVGVWTLTSSSLVSFYRAFSAIGIEPDEGIRNDVPPHVLTVYFGSERADESQPTQLSQTMNLVPPDYTLASHGTESPMSAK
jgi:hypothetical protein